MKKTLFAALFALSSLTLACAGPDELHYDGEVVLGAAYPDQEPRSITREASVAIETSGDRLTVLIDPMICDLRAKRVDGKLVLDGLPRTCHLSTELAPRAGVFDAVINEGSFEENGEALKLTLVGSIFEKTASATSEGRFDYAFTGTLTHTGP